MEKKMYEYIPNKLAAEEFNLVAGKKYKGEHPETLVSKTIEKDRYKQECIAMALIEDDFLRSFISCIYAPIEISLKDNPENRNEKIVIADLGTPNKEIYMRNRRQFGDFTKKTYESMSDKREIGIVRETKKKKFLSNFFKI